MCVYKEFVVILQLQVKLLLLLHRLAVDIALKISVKTGLMAQHC